MGKIESKDRKWPVERMQMTQEQAHMSTEEKEGWERRKKTYETGLMQGYEVMKVRKLQDGLTCYFWGRRIRLC